MIERLLEKSPISPWKSDARRFNAIEDLRRALLREWWNDPARNHLIYMLLDHFCRLYFFIFIQISLHNIHQPWLHDLMLWIWFGKMLSYVTWFSDLDAHWFHTPQPHTEGIASGWGGQHDLEFGVHTCTLLEMAHLMLSPGAEDSPCHTCWILPSKLVGGLVAKSCLTLATPCTVAHQAPLSIGFSKQEYWSGFPFPSLEDLPDPGVKPRSPALQAVSLLTELPGRPLPRRVISKSKGKVRSKKSSLQPPEQHKTTTVALLQ